MFAFLCVCVCLCVCGCVCGCVCVMCAYLYLPIYVRNRFSRAHGWREMSTTAYLYALQDHLMS